MDLHEAEERDFGRDGRLWDADPDVCCAAFQLGACEHTESPDHDDEDDTSITVIGWDGRSQPMYRYTADLDLPDHMRRIVAPSHRPDYQGA